MRTSCILTLLLCAALTGARANDVERAKPGRPLPARIVKLADEGLFDPKGVFALKTFPTERGNESLYIGIPPLVPDTGPQLAVYSIPLGQVVSLAADLNDWIKARPGQPAVQRQSQTGICPTFAMIKPKLYVGTADSPEPPGYEGGHLLEFDTLTKLTRDLGAVRQGWSIRELAVGGARELLVCIGRTNPKEETDLLSFNLADGRITDLKIDDVSNFWSDGAGWWYAAGWKTLLRRFQLGKTPERMALFPSKETLKFTAPEPVQWLGEITPEISQAGKSPSDTAAGNGRLFWNGAGYDFAYGVFPRTAMLMRMYINFGVPTYQSVLPKNKAMIDALTAMPPGPALQGGQAGKPECVAWVRAREFDPLKSGAVFLVRTAASGQGVELMTCSISSGETRVYGPIRDSKTGRMLESPVAVTVDRAGNIYVLGILRGALCLAEIEDVFIDEILAQQTQRVERALAGMMPNALRAESISLTAVAPHLDRPFNPPLIASDGRVYFTSMPHDPARSGCMLCYNPKTEKLINLGEIDAMTHPRSRLEVPSMIHCSPVEMSGYVFFTGEDPFYGKEWAFPEWPAGMVYQGSHIVGIDVKTGKPRDFDIPLPHASVFFLATDPPRSFLYMRQGYGGGPLYRMNVSTGKVEGLEFPAPDTFFIGPSGELFCSKDRNLVAFDTTTRMYRIMAKNTGKEWLWMQGQERNEEIYATSGADVWAMNLRSGQVRKLGGFAGGDALQGACACQNGVIYHTMWADINGVRATHLVTMNVATGKAVDRGLIVDQKGRAAHQIFSLSVAKDGTLYMAGTVWPKPGDPYSPRLKYDWLNDSCVLILRNFKP